MQEESGGNSYASECHSLLTPLFKRHIFDPLVSLVPTKVHANQLTVVGTMFCMASFALVVWMPPSRFSFLIVALFLLIYMTADNIDGAHARRTGGSSTLGEFLDHWLDTLNLSFIMTGFVLGFKVESHLALYCLGIGLLCYMMHVWEQRVTGRLVFPPWSDVETITCFSLMYLAAAIVGPDIIIDTRWFFGHHISEPLVLMTFIISPLSTLVCVYRSRSYLATLLLLSPIAAVILWYNFGALPVGPALALMMILSPMLCGRLVIAKVVQDKSMLPDVIFCAGIVVAACVAITMHFSQTIQTWMAGCLLAYAVILVVTDFIRSFRVLRQLQLQQ